MLIFTPSVERGRLEYKISTNEKQCTRICWVLSILNSLLVSWHFLSLSFSLSFFVAAVVFLPFHFLWIHFNCYRLKNCVNSIKNSYQTILATLMRIYAMKHHHRTSKQRMLYFSFIDIIHLVDLGTHTQTQTEHRTLERSNEWIKCLMVDWGLE